MQRPLVYRILLRSLLGFIIMKGTAGAAAELPVFEVLGLPITPHQLSVIGSRGVEEQLLASMPARGGMAASPHQIAILTQRGAARATATPSTPITIGASQNRVPPYGN